MNEMYVDAPQYTPAPAGTFQVVCCDVLDLGEEDQSRYKDERTGAPKPPARKFRYIFQLNHIGEDGKRAEVSRKFTWSLHPKAALTEFLVQWLGVPATQLPRPFNIASMQGVNARMRIMHEQKQDGTGIFANIKSIEPWDVNTMGPAITPEGYVRRIATPQPPIQPGGNAYAAAQLGGGNGAYAPVPPQPQFAAPVQPQYAPPPAQPQMAAQGGVATMAPPVAALAPAGLQYDPTGAITPKLWGEIKATAGELGSQGCIETFLRGRKAETLNMQEGHELLQLVQTYSPFDDN